MKNKIVIYKVTNIINNKVYIGATFNGLEKRKKSHLYLAENNNKNKSYFHNAIKKYSKDNFMWECIESFKDIFPIELGEKEKYWIKFYKSNNLNYGYNSTEGGEEFCIGSVPNKQTCEKMSKTRKERKLAIGKNNGMYGKGYLLEGKRNGMYGKNHTKESNEKNRKAHLGKKIGENHGMYGKGYKLQGENNGRYIKLDYELIVDFYFENPSKSYITNKYSKLKENISIIPIKRAFKELGLYNIKFAKGSMFKKDKTIFNSLNKNFFIKKAKDLNNNLLN